MNRKLMIGWFIGLKIIEFLALLGIISLIISPIFLIFIKSIRIYCEISPILCNLSYTFLIILYLIIFVVMISIIYHFFKLIIEKNWEWAKKLAR